MATFTYQALRPDGTKTRGEVDAKDRRAAIRSLTRQKLQAFDVKEAAKDGSPSRSEKNYAESASSDQPVKMRNAQLVQFTEELSDLLEAGMQLDTALKIMSARSEKSSLKVVATRIRERLQEGQPLAAALRSASPTFGELYGSLAAAGQAGGSLPQILRRHASYLRDMANLKGRFLFAMIYPAFLVVAGFGVTILFITFLIPSLAKLIGRSGEVPFMVKMLLGFSEMIATWWWLILILIALSILGAILAFRLQPVRDWWDQVSLKIPLFGPVILGRFYVQFLQTLSNLMSDGLPFLKAFELASSTSGNTYIKKRLNEMAGQVGEGRSFTASLRKSDIFPDRLADMVSVGEQTGQLSRSLRVTAERYDRELTSKIEAISAIIQPVIIIVMAVVVGTMAYFMISVIYDTIETMRQRQQ